MNHDFAVGSGCNRRPIGQQQSGVDSALMRAVQGLQNLSAFGAPNLRRSICINRHDARIGLARRLDDGLHAFGVAKFLDVVSVRRLDLENTRVRRREPLTAVSQSEGRRQNGHSASGQLASCNLARFGERQQANGAVA